MSYHRDPDELPGGADADPPAGLGSVPSAPISIAQVAEATGAEAARRKRKQAIIVGCVVVDVLIIIAVLAIFVF